MIVNDWLPPMFPRIQERRTTLKAKKAAEFFLLNISPEVVLQIAMMCDAAQEELDLSLVSQFVIDIVIKGCDFVSVAGDNLAFSGRIIIDLGFMGSVATALCCN